MTTTKDEAIRVLREAMNSILTVYSVYGSGVPIPVQKLATDTLAATSHIAPDAADPPGTSVCGTCEGTGAIYQCIICGGDEPHGGKCGSTDPRALCNFVAPDAAAIQAEGVSKRLFDSLEELRGILQRGAVSIDKIHELGADGPAEEAWQCFHDEIMPLYRAAGIAKASPAIAPEASELPPTDALAEVHAFLLGEGPLDGFHFGDSDTERPKARYWWRDNLRAAIAMHRAAAELRSDEKWAHEEMARIAEEAGFPNQAAAEPVPTDAASVVAEGLAGFIAPGDAWNDYATRSGLINELGVAPEPAKTQTAYFAYQAAWNQLHEQFTSRFATKPAASEAVCVQAVQANVMPPFAAPASQHIADTALLGELRRWAGDNQGYAACMFRSAADEIERLAEMLASGSREGRDANDSNTNLAAPAAPTDAKPLGYFSQNGGTAYTEVDPKYGGEPDVIPLYRGAPTDAGVRDKALADPERITELMQQARNIAPSLTTIAPVALTPIQVAWIIGELTKGARDE